MATSNVSEFLLEKWHAAFHFYDTDKNGVLTENDIVAIADYISEKTGANDEEAAKTRKEWLKWLEFMMPDSSVKEVDQARFVATIGELYKDVDLFRQMLRSSCSDTFDRLDLNKDGSISMEELTIFYEAVGVRDYRAILKHFNQLDTNGDGVIGREEFTEDFIRHYTDPDPTTGRAFLMTIL